MANYTLSARLTADAKQFVSGINQAKREMSNLQKFSMSVGQKFTNFGNSIGKVGNSLTNSITKPAMVAGGAVAGITFAKGFQRLTGIDNARAKLVGLGHDGKSVDKIMGSALTSVKGTAFGMDEAATTAASAVAAGIEPGKELTRYLSLTGDAAAIAGIEMSEMGSIINSVQTSNKAYNGDLQQLANRGLPVYQWLAKEAGISADAIFDMASQGEISSEMLLNAIENNIGGAAKKIGEESFTAGIANMWAAVGRLGASFLDAGGKGGGFFSTLKPLISDFTERLDSMGDIAEKAGVKFGEMFIAAIEKVKEIKQWYDDLNPAIQNIINKTLLWGSIGAVAIGPILQIVSKVSLAFGFLGEKVIPKVISAFNFLRPAFVSLGGPIGITIAIIAVLVAAFIYAYNTSETFRETVQRVFGIIKDVISDVVSAVSSFIMEVWGQVVSWWEENNEMILQATENVWGVVSTIIEVAMNIIMGIFQLVWPIVKMLVIDTWNAIKNVIQGAINVILGIISFFAALFTGDWSALWDATKQILSGAVQLLWGLVNLWFVGKILKVGKTFMNLFKNVFQTGWNFIKGIFSGTINVIKSVVSAGFNAIKSVTSTVMNAIRTVISTVWNVIKGVITTVVNAVKNVVTKVWNGIKSTTSSVFNAVRTVVSTVWNGIKNVITAVVNTVKSKVTSVWNGIKSTTSSVFNGIRGIASSVWNGIRSVISGVVNGIRSAVTSVWNGIKSTTSSVFNGIRSTATSVWNGIKDAMTKPVETAKNTISGVIDTIKGFFSGLSLKFPEIKMPKLPKFSMTGKFGLNPPSVPKLGISWNAKGGIMNRPTIFGANGNTLMGGGEAGPEAILPLNSKVLGGIGKGIASTMTGNNETTTTTEYDGGVTEIIVPISLEGKEIARVTAPYIDRELGRQRSNKMRAGGGY